MKEKCFLCDSIAEVNRPDIRKGEYSVECDTCKNYSYDHFFKSAYASMEEDKRAMISAYTRECFELGKEPIKLGDPDNLKEIIEEYRKKTIDEKLDNLIFYLKRKSNYLGGSVTWDEKKDYPITYSPNPQEFIKIRDHAIKRNLLFWKSRGAGLELSGDGWEKAEKLEKEAKMEMREKSRQFLKALFELTRGDENDNRDMWEIGKALGFPNSLINRVGQYLKGEGSIAFRTEQGEISITHEGVKEVEEATTRKDEIELKKRVNEKSKADPKKVFVVHGRNEKARKALFEFLRSIGIEPIEWGVAKKMTGETSPYPEQVLDAAFSHAQAIIVLITGDDIAKLRTEYFKRDDEEYEKRLTPQARPNVIFEAGLAFGRNPKRTILVSLKNEKTRPFSDILGRLFVKLSNIPQSRNDLISQLETAGCKIDIKGKTDWMNAGDFDNAVIEYKENKKSLNTKKKAKNKDVVLPDEKPIVMIEKIIIGGIGTFSMGEGKSYFSIRLKVFSTSPYGNHVSAILQESRSLPPITMSEYYELPAFKSIDISVSLDYEEYNKYINKNLLLLVRDIKGNETEQRILSEDWEKKEKKIMSGAEINKLIKRIKSSKKNK